MTDIQKHIEVLDRISNIHWAGGETQEHQSLSLASKVFRRLEKGIIKKALKQWGKNKSPEQILLSTLDEIETKIIQELTK